MTTPQARAEDVILGATLRWAGDAADLADCREVAALTAAALAEAGLLTHDPDECAGHYRRVVSERDAARAELVEVNSYAAAVDARRQALHGKVDRARQSRRRAEQRAEQAEAREAELREGVRHAVDDLLAAVHEGRYRYERVHVEADLTHLRALLGEES